jgi:hypothetical protein
MLLHTVLLHSQQGQTVYEQGLKVWRHEKGAEELSSPALANVSEISLKFGEARPIPGYSRCCDKTDPRGILTAASRKMSSGKSLVSVLTRDYAPAGPSTYGVSIVGRSFVVSKEELKKLNAAWTRQSQHEFILTHDWYRFYPFRSKRRFCRPFRVCGSKQGTNVDRAQTWTGPVRLCMNDSM